ncbi:MAG: hypothetical protein DRI86_04135 [Bacteroidetes bacterium]|nr:MAG: hypothetical protein DRI86_04135 [Bacteroidota bacterium]
MQNFTSEKAKELANNGYFFNRAYYLQRALSLVKPHWKLLMAFTTIYLGSMFLLLINPAIGQIVQMVVSGPISAGYYYTLKKIIDNEVITINDFFEGFKSFVPTMLVFMMVNLLTTVSLALYYFPAIFVATIYLFAMPLVVFGKMTYWKAMESSRIIIMKKFWEALLFGATIIGINILGILALGVGLLFTLPLSYALILVAYEDIYGFENEPTYSKNDFSHFR